MKKILISWNYTYSFNLRYYCSNANNKHEKKTTKELNDNALINYTKFINEFKIKHIDVFKVLKYI